jgi:ubiquinone/menaquinone biosynthesis C-methylase UbiE
MTQPDGFIPALSYRILTPLYDVAIRFMMREREFKLTTLRAAGLQPSSRLLDLGCGTGTLLKLAAREEPGASLTGVDADSRILDIARRKLARAEVRLENALAAHLPFPDGSFDHIVSTLFFHHLTTTQKADALRECFRLIAPGGRLVIGDFGPPHGKFAAFVSSIVVRISGPEIAGSYCGVLPTLLREAGFKDVADVTYIPSMFGTLSIIRGMK